MSRASTAQKTQTCDTQHRGEPAADKNASRRFHLIVPEAEPAELPRPINEPERDTVSDELQSIELAMIEELPRFWAPDDDWREREAKLNALPHFRTEIDGLDILLIACIVFLAGRII